MRSIVCGVILIFLFDSKCYGQDLSSTKEYVDQWVIHTFTDIGSMDFRYIIDGVYSERGEELRAIDPGKIWFIDHISAEVLSGGNTMWCTTPRPVVLVLTAKQKRRDVKSVLQELNKLEPGGFPALVKNGNIVPPESSWNYIKTLKAKNLAGIYYIHRPVNIDHYGEAGSNGLVVIKNKN